MLLSHGALHAGYQVYSSHGWFLSRIIELSNFSSHGESRRATVLLSRDLSFGPTDQREVICELSIILHTECHGWSRFYCPEFANCRIFLHTENRGGHGCLSRIFFLSRDLSFGPTDQREVIIEFLSSRGMSRMVAEVMRVAL